jgi:hypothetical protein
MFKPSDLEQWEASGLVQRNAVFSNEWNEAQMMAWVKKAFSSAWEEVRRIQGKKGIPVGERGDAFEPAHIHYNKATIVDPDLGQTWDGQYVHSSIASGKEKTARIALGE